MVNKEPHGALKHPPVVESQTTEVFIPDTQRLVPLEGYKIDVESEIVKGATTKYPGYPLPAKRIHMTTNQIYSWQEAGGKTVDLPVEEAKVMNHPNYHKGLVKGRAIRDDGKQDFHDTVFEESFYPQGYKRDERGLPIRPNDEQFLQAGAIEGIGFYWNYGPNKAADPVVFREKAGKLQVLVIRRKDTETVALPGGMVDPKEPDVSAALRELFEEAGIDLRDVPHQVVHRGIVWADPRATRHAWPESTVALVMPGLDRTDNVSLNAGDDAREALWLDASQDNIAKLAFSHPGFVILAAGAWQRETGKVVAIDGKIGKHLVIPLIPKDS